MRITEVLSPMSAINEIRQSLATDYQAVMKSHGFTPIGKGSFATVWEHPNFNYVVKTFNARNTAFLQWFKAALSNQNNPFIPKYLSAKPLRIAPGVLGVKMERLAPTSGSAATIIELTDELIEDFVQSGKEESIGFFGIQQEMQKHYPQLVSFAKANDGYTQAVAAILNIIVNGAGVNDLSNPKNAMMRGNQLVFTDPV
jgi:hypothetical protein